MDTIKKILKISIAFSLVCISLSVLIYSIRDSKAIAAPQKDANGYEVVGVVITKWEDYVVVGYNPTTADMKILARKTTKQIKEE